MLLEVFWAEKVLGDVESAVSSAEDIRLSG